MYSVIMLLCRSYDLLLRWLWWFDYDVYDDLNIDLTVLMIDYFKRFIDVLLTVMNCWTELRMTFWFYDILNWQWDILNCWTVELLRFSEKQWITELIPRCIDLILPMRLFGWTNIDIFLRDVEMYIIWRLLWLLEMLLLMLIVYDMMMMMRRCWVYLMSWYSDIDISNR